MIKNSILRSVKVLSYLFVLIEVNSMCAFIFGQKEHPDSIKRLNRYA